MQTPPTGYVITGYQLVQPTVLTPPPPPKPIFSPCRDEDLGHLHRYNASPGRQACQCARGARGSRQRSRSLARLTGSLGRKLPQRRSIAMDAYKNVMKRSVRADVKSREVAQESCSCDLKLEGWMVVLILILLVPPPPPPPPTQARSYARHAHLTVSGQSYEYC